MKHHHDMQALVHDGPLRWSVTSRTRPEIEHLVDLEGFGGIGNCSCEHFQFRIAPQLREGQRTGARRCSHILVAREAFADAMIQVVLHARRSDAGIPATAPEPEPTPEPDEAWDPAPPSDRHCQHCGEASDTAVCPLCQFEFDHQP